MHPLRPRSAGSRTTRSAGGPTAPSVPGFALCRALRASGGGPPWRARQTATGYDVVLRPLPAGVGAADFEELPEHPHLAIPSVVAGADGCSYSVTRHAPHGGLDTLVARRGALAPGEVATVVLAVGRALAAMHAQGRVHGSVAMAAVLLDTGLRPLLDASLARPAGGSPGLRAEDVRALGALALLLLGSEVQPELRACLSAATDPDPGLRPQATDLVRLVVAAVPPEALRLSAETDRAIVPVPRLGPVRQRLRRTGRTTPAPRRRHGGDRAPRRWRPAVLPVLAAVALLALAVVAGAAWAKVSGDADVVPQALDRPARPAATVASASASPSAAATPAVDWGQILDDLDTARGAAFANADTGALSLVDAPGSPASARDTVAVRALADRGVQARGFRIDVLAVLPVSVGADSAVLSVTDRREAYEIVDSTGSVVSTQPLRAVAGWQVELVRVHGTWLIRDVR